MQPPEHNHSFTVDLGDSWGCSVDGCSATQPKQTQPDQPTLENHTCTWGADMGGIQQCTFPGCGNTRPTYDSVLDDFDFSANSIYSTETETVEFDLEETEGMILKLTKDEEDE